jgi:hypothetical protein
MRTGTEMNGFSAQADQLGEAQAGLGGEQQQCVIAPAEPRRPIGRSEGGFDLGTRQEIYLTLVVSLARYREHALDEGAVSRLFEGHKPEEGAHGGQAQVACRDAGAALHLEIGQERADERRVQFIEGQGGRRLAKLRHRELQQQPERIPVGRDRMDAHVLLTDKPLGKKAFDEWGDIATGLHG